MVVNVDPQEISLANDSSAAVKIGQTVCRQVRDNAAKPGSDVQLIDPPKIEPDDRFFLRVHHRFKKADRTADQLQIYRAIGTNLVAVAVTVWTDSPDEANGVQKIAEQVLLSARARGAAVKTPPVAAQHALPRPSSRPAVPLSLPQAKLRIATPASLGNWQLESADAPAGIVLTFRESQPAHPFELIAVSVKQLPKEALKDPKLRDAIVEEMASGERQQLKLDGVTGEPKIEAIKDNRFLRKMRAVYQTRSDQVQLTSRQLRIGEVVVSVVGVAGAEQAAAIDKMADELALSIRAIGR